MQTLNQLKSLVEQLGRNPLNCWSVHIDLTKLPAYSNRDSFLNMAVNSMRAALDKRLEYQVFSVSILESIIIIFRNADVTAIEPAIEKIRYVFSYSKNDDMVQEDQFCTWLNLYHELSTLKQLVHTAIQRELDRQRRHVVPTVKNSKPMTVGHLDKLEQSIRNADLANFIRQQNVWAVSSLTEPPCAVFREYFVSVKDLSNLAHDIDILANRFLFQHLTLTLDQRILSYVSRDDSVSNGVISINLNMDTVNSEVFQKFQKSLNVKRSGTIIVEFQASDVFSDLQMFRMTCDYLHTLKFRVVVDGLDHENFSFLARPNMPADFFKLRWDPAIAHSPSVAKELLVGIERLNKGKVIMTRCEDESHVSESKKLGIFVFQGFFLDRWAKEVAIVKPKVA